MFPRWSCIKWRRLTVGQPTRAALAAALLVVFSAGAEAQILVVAPHPDDDVLIAAGVVYRAQARGEAVRIVFVTNGDINGTASGLTRQGEAVGAQAVLGTPEDDLIFLGYPDGGLTTMRQYYTSPESAFTSAAGVSATYGTRGLGRVDYHTYRTGSPGPYNWPTAVADLADIVGEFRPLHVFTLSRWDTHRDHSATYALVLEAAARVTATLPGYTPTLHTTIVWSGADSWPNALDPTAYFTEVPKVDPQNDLQWGERESLDVPLAMQSWALSNPKTTALAAHATQGGFRGYLGRFLHKDEFFWTQALTGTNRPPVPDAGGDQTVIAGTVVILDGNLSFDGDNEPLSFQWRQVAGPAVTLSGATSSRPTFTAPSEECTLVFELVVTDGTLVSAPDAVSTLVSTRPPEVNVAPGAAVTASSQNVSTSQVGQKVVDGAPTGYPLDYTREWATLGERAGAWIELRWSAIHTVGRVRVYDRPNLNDHVTSGTLAFSDGTSVAVGPLDNSGAGVDVLFSPRVVEWIRFTVQTVAPSTSNIGLSEIEVFEASGEDRAPTANAGPDQAVGGGATVTLDGSGSSDPEGQALTYAWVQASGPGVTLSSATVPRPTFTAPAATATPQSLVFRLVVNDGMQDSTPATVTITVSAQNLAPTANAGSDQTVAGGSVVTLDGRASSDPESAPLTFLWTQTAGARVALSSNVSATPSFQAPTSRGKPHSLIFQLVVSDGGQASAADSVVVTVEGKK